jgi:hypothetical protein
VVLRRGGAGVKRRPVVGETLFDLAIGNSGRGRTEDKITPVKVLSVGRKYFVCGEDPKKTWGHTKYDIETWEEVTQYCRNHCLYESLQERIDERATAEIRDYLRARFGTYSDKTGFTLDQLRRIKAITEESAT